MTGPLDLSLLYQENSGKPYLNPINIPERRMRVDVGSTAVHGAQPKETDDYAIKVVLFRRVRNRFSASIGLVDHHFNFIKLLFTEQSSLPK